MIKAIPYYTILNLWKPIPREGGGASIATKAAQGISPSVQLGLPYVVPSIRRNAQNNSARKNLAAPANKAYNHPKPRFFQIAREGNMILCGITPSDPSSVLRIVLSTPLYDNPPYITI